MNRSGNKKETLICALVVAGILLATSRDAHADYVFGEPTNLGPPINTSHNDSGPSISADGLSLFFASNRPGGQGWDIWFTTRATTSDPWGEPVNLGAPVNTFSADVVPTISTDGLSLYFASDQPGGYGIMDLWVTTRASVSDPWGDPVNLGSTVNSSVWECRPNISADGLSLFFGSNREKIGTPYSATTYLYVTTRPTTNDPWSTPVRLGATINPEIWYDVSWPCISADGQILFFGSDRPGGMGSIDLWLARRSAEDGEWGTAVNLGPSINTQHSERRISLSADGRMLYFVSDRPGGFGGKDIWQVSVEPIVDLNSDGIVDCADMCIIVDNWGTDEPLCDIGPTPFGDGVVDVQDLIVLAEHLFEEFPPADPNNETP